MRFLVAGNPDYLFKISRHGDEQLNIYSNGQFLGDVAFTYKNMVLSVHDSGIDFKAVVSLKDLNFIEPKQIKTT